MTVGHGSICLTAAAWLQQNHRLGGPSCGKRRHCRNNDSLSCQLETLRFPVPGPKSHCDGPGCWTTSLPLGGTIFSHRVDTCLWSSYDRAFPVPRQKCQQTVRFKAPLLSSARLRARLYEQSVLRRGLTGSHQDCKVARLPRQFGVNFIKTTVKLNSFARLDSLSKKKKIIITQTGDSLQIASTQSLHTFH